MKIKIIKVLISLITIAIVLYLFPIGKLLFTNAEVTKSILGDEYYVKITSDKNEYDVFSNYMNTNGWKENKSKSDGGLHVFERNDEIKGVANFQIKTIVLNGKLNVQAFIHRFIK